MGMVKRICANLKCRQEFMARSADVKRGWAKCCSKSCAATFNNKKTGNYQRYMRSQDYDGVEWENNHAHLFSNEEHDCNKE